MRGIAALLFCLWMVFGQAQHEHAFELEPLQGLNSRNDEVMVQATPLTEPAARLALCLMAALSGALLLHATPAARMPRLVGGLGVSQHRSSTRPPRA